MPGNRVLIQGIYSIKTVGGASKRGPETHKAVVGVRSPYLRVVGIKVDTEIGSISRFSNITSDEEAAFRKLAAMPDIYEKLAKSIAPSIFGSLDVKKAIVCLLFGGSRKKLPDGLLRRGDINMLSECLFGFKKVYI